MSIKRLLPVLGLGLLLGAGACKGYSEGEPADMGAGRPEEPNAPSPGTATSAEGAGGTVAGPEAGTGIDPDPNALGTPSDSAGQPRQPPGPGTGQ